MARTAVWNSSRGAFESTGNDLTPTGTAYTQTYATTATTVPAATATAVATTSAGLAIYGFSQAQADAIPVAINALLADVLALRKTMNQIIDDLQSMGIVT